MNRRDFLKNLTLGTAAIAIYKKLPEYPKEAEFGLKNFSVGFSISTRWNEDDFYANTNLNSRSYRHTIRKDFTEHYKRWRVDEPGLVSNSIFPIR